jgi:hypothetical protein
VIVSEIIGLAESVHVLQHGLPHQQGLHDECIDLSLYLFHIIPLACEQVVDGSEGALVADVHVVLAGIEDELLVGLIDGVVGEVDEVVLQVLLPGPLVGLGGEPGQPLLVDVDPHWVAPVDQHVDAHVELEAVDQQRVIHVQLHDARPALQLFSPREQHDSLPLRGGFRFEYIDWLFLFTDL